MATPLEINDKGFTVLYEAPQPAVEYVLFYAVMSTPAPVTGCKQWLVLT